MKARRHSLGSDHTFSEMSFLSQGNHPSLHPVSSVRDGPASQRERECRQEPQLEHHLCDRKLAMSHSSNNLCGVKRRLDTSHSPSFTVKGPNAREVSTDVHGFRNAASEPQTKRRKTSSRSPSVPYTSSESDVGGLDESRGIEQYLLDVLHAGLDHQALCSEDSKPVLARRYWSLSELWVLLWERQAFWSNETGNEKQASHEPTPEQPAAAEVTPEKLQENKFQNSASEPQTKRKKASSRSPSLRGMKRKLDTSHSPSFTVKEPNAREVSTDVHGFQNAASEPHTKRRKTSSRSPSVPYTSSESDVGGLDESRGIEQYLLDILHAGLGHQALCSEDSKPVLARRYWSLSELWVLLWERQPFWSNETGNEIQASHEPTPEQPAAAEVTPEKLQENDSPGIPDSVEASQSHTEMSNPTPKTMVETASTASSDGLEQHSVLGPQGNAAQEENEALQISDRKGYLNVASNVAEASNKQYFYTETWNEDNCESPLEGPGDDSASPAPTLEVQQVPVPNIDIYEISQIDDDDEFYHTLDVAYDEITSPGLMAKVANLQRSIAKNGLDGSRPQPTQNADYLDEFDVTEDTEEGEPKELATVSENTIQDNHGSRPPEPCQQHEEPLQYSNYPLFHQSNELSGEWPWLAREYAQPTFPSSPEINARLSRFPGIRGFWRQNRLY
ncbi:uncharacterized protein N7515_008073 [Penicillium bovifimosum]|uniref:Uncharacterized protein n=1 Tax=Penicillium bovifimosum TaxID=126998 RepID=A0A9W9GMA9_9EURO|nr:uncharacterized protein N7515_008073 [Penicillium bovifimosum]KAJ5124248.1 hypothetical protein N7515_008073 [Penicillium bovifimosum]